MDTFSTIKAALVKATGQHDGEDEQTVELAGWTWHDFRRSFASALGEASFSERLPTRC